MPRHFVIGGAQRSATTYLYQLLDQHPAVSMAHPVRPEPKYFIRPDYLADLQAYRATCFADAPGDALWLGEKSTSYIEHPVAAERIAALVPDAIIVFVLRDPVERAISNYHFSVMHGLETLPLEAALEAEPGRAASAGVSVSPFAYVDRGMYARHLDAWSRVFPPAQLRLWTTERLVGTEDAVDEVLAALSLGRTRELAGIGAPINRAPATSEVPDHVRNRLRARFAEANRELADRYGVDIGKWQS